MATDITLRATKGSSLTHAEMDQNFESLSVTIDGKVGNYSILYTDQNKIVEMNGASITATLPTIAAASGTDTDSWEVTIKNLHSSDLTVDGDGAETIEGNANLTVPQWGCVTLALDSGATEWNIKHYTTTWARLDIANTFAAAQTFSSTIAVTGTATVTGAATFSDDATVVKTLTQKVGLDAASATALTLGDGNMFDITGTTAITSIVTKGVGTKVTLQFDGILTLTHDATNLILPSGANITTAAGDVAVFYEYATGDYRCVSYTKADGGPVVISSGSLASDIGAWILISSQTASASSAIDFNTPSTYDDYMVVLRDVKPTTAGSDLYFLISDAGGFFSTNYSYNGLTAQSQIIMATDLHGSHPFFSDMRFSTPDAAATLKMFTALTTYVKNTSDVPSSTRMFGLNTDQDAITQIRFKMTGATTIASGEFEIYGRNNS